jgi:hypothetical protein
MEQCVDGPECETLKLPDLSLLQQGELTVYLAIKLFPPVLFLVFKMTAVERPSFSGT